MYLRVYTAPQPEYDRRIVEMRNEHESFVREQTTWKRECEGVEWTHLAHNRDHYRPLVNTANVFRIAGAELFDDVLACRESRCSMKIVCCQRRVGI